MSRRELGLVILLAAAGTAISFAVVDLYDTSLITAKFALLFVSVSISVLLFYVLLAALNAPAGSRLAGSLWGSLPWNSVQLWQVPYIGFLFIPLEIIGAGLIVSFRAGVVVWKSVIASLVVRVVVLVLYHSVRSQIIHLLLR